MRLATRKILVTTILISIILIVAQLFWKTEFVYSLPTPVPNHYKAVSLGTKLNIREKLNLNPEKPILIHFFNPECPCSKFNIPHFISLYNQYGNQIQFVFVALPKSQPISEAALREKYNLKMPIYFDKTLAENCGVYSTPQAAIIDKDDKLFFRGNYNRNRYCTDKQTEFVRQAIQSILNNSNYIEKDLRAMISYGCTLPNCKK